MKVVLLAGGLGSRISEESDLKPKPMIEIGGKPLLWHIMKTYSKHNFKEFIVCLGYKGHVIIDYFKNYFYHASDIEVDLSNGELNIIKNNQLDWKISLIDTGLKTNTAGRLKKISGLLDSTFLMTYGDGLSNVDISSSVKFHKNHKKLVTVTGVRPPGRFGVLKVDEMNQVTSFSEKSQAEEGFINGGFFVVEPEALEYINENDDSWESDCLPAISKVGQLKAFKHYDYWKPCDTLRDKRILEKDWLSGKPPWFSAVTKFK